MKNGTKTCTSVLLYAKLRINDPFDSFGFGIIFAIQVVALRIGHIDDDLAFGGGMTGVGAMIDTVVGGGV